MYNMLREKYPRFEYRGFRVENNDGRVKIVYDFYQSEDIAFEPSWQLPFAYEEYESSENKALLNTCIFNLGMVEAVSYWKACCSPVFYVFAHLDEEQKAFWKKLYFNGLGEFFYVNKIEASQNDFMQICCGDEKYGSSSTETTESCLVPVGGGKDSIVTLERLKKYGANKLCYIINPNAATLKTAELSETLPICAKRTLDKRIIELNGQGYLNGHTPFSAIVAFSAFLCAVFEKKKYIVLSNESSANDVYVKGTTVNHQYSKSVEFENDFRSYSKKYLCPQIEYFSLLRPLNEWSIVKEFVLHKKYFPVFRSCNLGSKTGVWCKSCSKCLFTYIMLSPFLDDKELCEIFGENLLDKKEMLKYFDGLVNPEIDKPFECVGTRGEINAALTLAVQKRKNNLPLLLQKYKNEYYDEGFDFAAVDNYYDQNNNIPASFSYIGKIANFFTNKAVAILGYGREGKSSYEFLKAYASPKSITIIDRNEKDISDTSANGVFGEKYLEGLEKYDIIMKAPGIALLDLVSDSVKSRVTSQTDLFLRFRPCKVIGITGTKGKSTTSSAIYHALKKQGFLCRLVGNIGVPVFSDFASINEKTVVVYELSCHQLEYVKASPSTAVLLNIFSDHLDHYVSQQAYADAKRNIYRFQKPEDFLITNEKTNSLSKKLCVSDYIDIQSVKTKLIGQHNKYNLAVAALAAQTVGADTQKTLKILEDFNGLEHRIEFFATINGVAYYNDSISTIPEATLGAIDGIGNVTTLILGGFDRGISYDELAKKLSQSKVENIICAYESGKRVYGLIQSQNHKPKLFLVDNLKQAVKTAKSITHGGSCLLSPAAASYGDFTDFEQRGKIFKELVKDDKIC